MDENELFYHTAIYHPHRLEIRHFPENTKVIWTYGSIPSDLSERRKILMEADSNANSGRGYTYEEWKKESDIVISYCYKECRFFRKMVKGHVLEFGVRGVYVCLGCGYAYPYGSIEETEEDELIYLLDEACSYGEDFHERLVEYKDVFGPELVDRLADNIRGKENGKKSK